MHANRFTALLDASVLAPQIKCDLLLSLADAELYRARWSERILCETETAVVRMLRDRGIGDAVERAARKRAAISGWPGFADCLVEDFEALEQGLPAIPEQDDGHVVAAALKTKASVIVTDNLRDFPTEVMRQLELEAKSADAFIADAVDLSPRISVQALAAMRARYEKTRPLSAEEFVNRLERNGLKETAAFVGHYVEFL